MTAERWGLVNAVVPAGRAVVEARVALGGLAASGLELFVGADEAKEGAAAFVEKRAPRF